MFHYKTKDSMYYVDKKRHILCKNAILDATDSRKSLKNKDLHHQGTKRHLLTDLRYLFRMFTTEEKALVADALKIYAQMLGQQYGPAEMQALLPVMKEILSKLDQAGNASAAAPGAAPVGIKDEWYQAVCLTCPKLGPKGCQDPVTAKWPGKCDPILTWERKKLLQQ